MNLSAFFIRSACLSALVASIAACASSTPRPPANAYVRAQPVADSAPPPSAASSRAAPPAAPPSVPSWQMKPMPPAPSVRSTWGLLAQAAANTQQIVSEANREASQGPAPGAYFNAIAQYVYEPGTLYEVYAAPMRITDIALEPGERVLGQPAAGDVVRWVLAIGKSMVGGVEQAHVYLKPTRADLETNLAINTDRRSYLLELHSYADTYMAAVEWRYPQEEIARLGAQEAEAAADVHNAAPVVALDALNFNYAVKVEKGEPTWTPVQVFDDGRRTFIRFPPAMLVREAPALFVLRNKETQLVNYRVKNDFYVVDRLIDSAELRVGQQDQEIVRITRAPAGRR
jgi:type IV secretion system protein TrbG